MIPMRVCLGSRTVEGTSITTVIGENEGISSLLAELPITRKGSGTPSASNIRPFVLWDEIILYDANDEEIYHGTFDAVPQGEAKTSINRVVSAYGYIASYDGEELPAEWYSDRDADGSVSPTLGAEVVYALDGNISRNIEVSEPLPTYSEGDTFSAHGEADGSVSDEGYAEGSIATIPPAETVTEDGVTYTPASRSAKSVVIGIEPKQDLHGYDNPWPAGGGKNILPPIGNNDTFQNITISYDAETETYTLNGSTTSPGNIPLATIEPSLLKWTEDEYYTLSCKVVSGNFTLGGESGITYALALFDSSSTKFIRGSAALTESDLNGYSGTGKAFASSGNYSLMLQCWRVGTVFNNLKIKIQIEKGSSATSWTPYSNICPISGWTGAEVQRAGKNLLDEQYQVVSRNNIYSYESNRFLLKKGVTYVYGTTVVKSGLYITGDGVDVRDYSLRNPIIYTPTKDELVYFNVFWADDRIPSGGPSKDVVYLNVATDQGYEPYHGTTYPISWQTEAGTVYGGTVDVTTGVLTVELASVDLSQITPTMYTVQIGGQSVNLFRFNVSGIKTISSVDALPNIYCSIYPTKTFGARTNQSIAQPNSLAVIDVLDNRFSSASECQNGMGGVQVFYPLATPITYNLTPTDIALLQGTNNVWADTGDVEVTYKDLFNAEMIPSLEAEIGAFKEYEGTMCGKRHTPNFPTNPLVKPLLKAVVNGENALMTTDCVEVAPCGAVAVVCEATVCNTVVACDNE